MVRFTIPPPSQQPHVRNYDTRKQVRMNTQSYMRFLTIINITSSILIDVEIETDPSISYPTLEAFMTKLGNDEPTRRWSDIFLAPLRWMGVRTIDDTSGKLEVTFSYSFRTFFTK